MELQQPFYNHEGRDADFVVLPNLRFCDMQKPKLRLLKPLKSNVFLTDRIVIAIEVQRD